MKKNLLPLMLLLAFGQLKTIAVQAQANNALSNLVSPAVNVDLLPGATNTVGLGSSTLAWTQLYVNNLIYLGGAPFISYGSSISGQNTGVGSFALAGVTTGTNNTGLGAYSLRGNTTGYNNVGVGYTSLFKSVNGHNNVAVGVASMYYNTTGVSNSALGNSALTANTSGSNNIAVGALALGSNINGYSNVAIGVRAMYSNRNNNNMVAVGDSALFSFNSPVIAANVAVGSNAMYGTTAGTDNAAVGWYALNRNTTGSYNTALGSAALQFAPSFSGNTAVGFRALYAPSSGFNTAVGSETLELMSTGGNNVAIGAGALYTVTSGGANTALGTNADVSYGAMVGSTAIGYAAKVTSDYTMVLGNTSLQALRSSASSVMLSDGRFKKDITENVPGLAFVLALRPVSYHYDIHGINNFTASETKKPRNGLAGTADWEEAAIQAKEKKLYSGFVAQEVEATAKNLRFEFSGLYKPQNDKDLYGLSYSDFVVPLVKSVQELDSTMAKKSTVDSLKNEIDSLKAALQEIRDLVRISNGGSVSPGQAFVGQNYPNPVRGTTVIQYTLPAGYGRAKIMITDMNGRVLQTIAVTGTGNGLVNINTKSMAAGSYPYTLYVDGAIVGTKQMLVVR